MNKWKKETRLPDMERYDCIIIGTGPAGLGCAFHLIRHNPTMKILILDREKVSTGGLRNDCKMNFTFPVGFSLDNWAQVQAETYLDEVIRELEPRFMEKNNLSVYKNRAEKLGVSAAKLIHPIRICLTGSHVSPGLFEVMHVLGKNTVIDRIKKGITKIHNE